MQVAKPAVLKPGVTVESLPGPRDSDLAIVDAAAAPLDSRQGADLLGSEEPVEETRRDRHRSDHAGRRLRVGEPRHARRAMEGRIVPLPDAGFPRPRASRRDVRDRRRSVCDRQLARNVAGRPEGDRRRSRPRDGDHLRQQHGRHLPPQLVQPRPARRAEPGGGRRRARRRRVHVRSGVAPDRQRHAGQDLHAGAAERRRKTRSARAAASSRSAGASSASSVERTARDRVSRRAIARARCRRPRRSSGRIASTRTPRSRRARRCASTPTCCRHPTAPRRFRFTRSIRSPAATRSFRGRRRSPTITSSSPAKKTTTSRRRSARQFAAFHGIEKPYYATPGDGIFHFYFPEQGLVLPGQFIPGADSHSRAYGAYGAVGMGVGSTTLGFGWSTGYIYFTMAQRAPRHVPRQAEPLGHRQGHRPRAAAPMGREAVAGHVGGARRRRQAAADRVSQHHRQHDGGGRSAERHLRAGRDHLRVVSREGHRPTLPYPQFALRRRRALRDRRGVRSRPTSRR